MVRDSHYSSMKDPAPPVYYTPWRQDDKLNGLHFYVRSAVEPGGTTEKNVESLFAGKTACPVGVLAKYHIHTRPNRTTRPIWPRRKDFKTGISILAPESSEYAWNSAPEPLVLEHAGKVHNGGPV